MLYAVWRDLSELFSILNSSSFNCGGLLKQRSFLLGKSMASDLTFFWNEVVGNFISTRKFGVFLLVFDFCTAETLHSPTTKTTTPGQNDFDLYQEES